MVGVEGLSATSTDSCMHLGLDSAIPLAASFGSAFVCRAAVVLGRVFCFKLPVAPITNFNHLLNLVRAPLILLVMLFPPYLYRRVAPLLIALPVRRSQRARRITGQDVVCFDSVFPLKWFQAKVAVGRTSFYFLSPFPVLGSVELLLPGFFDFRPSLVPSAICDLLMLRAAVPFA